MLQEENQSDLQNLADSNPHLSALFNPEKMNQPINRLEEKEELI